MAMKHDGHETSLSIVTVGYAYEAISKGNVVDIQSISGEGTNFEKIYVKKCSTAAKVNVLGIATRDFVIGEPVSCVKMGECPAIIDAALTRGTMLTTTATGGLNTAASLATAIAYLQQDAASGDVAIVDLR